MPLDTRSESRIPVTGVNEAKDELHALGRAAARQRPAHETKKFQKTDFTVPRDAKLGFLVGGSILVLCVTTLVVQKISNRPEAPAKTVAPAITAPPPAPEPKQD